MAMYRVIWEIDIEADSPEHAAAEALAIQRDPESIATVFTVRSEKEIDLLKNSAPTRGATDER